jgi:holo-[acyl-carrier protein] synthase
MTIAGIGIDIVDLARFERAVSRTPALRDRLFAPSERDLPLRSLAGRFAAKEALIKALGDSAGVTWHDMEVVSDEHGNPEFVLHGAAAEILERRGITALHLSMSHDAGVAVANVIAESA